MKGSQILNGSTGPTGTTGTVGDYFINTTSDELLEYGEAAVLLTPPNISGLQLWLDAADPAGNGVLPADATTVSTWADKSGLGYDGTVSGTYTFNTNVLNDLPAITKGDSNSKVVCSIPAGTFIRAMNIFIVYRSTNVLYTSGLICRGTSTGPTNYGTPLICRVDICSLEE